MSDRCEPPPELRGVDGWHWVQFADGRVVAIEWHPKTNAWWQGSSFTPAGSALNYNWRYLSPVAPPAEVDALRAELERERMRLAACGVVALSDTPDSAKRNRDMLPEYRSASCDDVARRVDECMALRARVSELESALRAIKMCGSPPLSSCLDELASLITTQAGYDALSVALEKARRALEGGT